MSLSLGGHLCNHQLLSFGRDRNVIEAVGSNWGPRQDNSGEEHSKWWPLWCSLAFASFFLFLAFRDAVLAAKTLVPD